MIFFASTMCKTSREDIDNKGLIVYCGENNSPFAPTSEDYLSTSLLTECGEVSGLTGFHGRVSGCGKNVARGIRVGEGPRSAESLNPSGVTVERESGWNGETYRLSGRERGCSRRALRRRERMLYRPPSQFSLLGHGVSHALFLCGNGIVLCAPSSVKLACLSSSRRLSINHLATPAASRCARASSHSPRAAFRHCWLRFRQASSTSWSDCSEQSRR